MKSQSAKKNRLIGKIIEDQLDLKTVNYFRLRMEIRRSRRIKEKEDRTRLRQNALNLDFADIPSSYNSEEYSPTQASAGGGSDDYDLPAYDYPSEQHQHQGKQSIYKSIDLNIIIRHQNEGLHRKS